MLIITTDVSYFKKNIFYVVLFFLLFLFCVAPEHCLRGAMVSLDDDMMMMIMMMMMLY